MQELQVGFEITVVRVRSCSDHARVVDISHGVFHSRLKTFLLSKYFPHSRLSLAQADLPEFDHSVFDSHWW